MNNCIIPSMHAIRKLPFFLINTLLLYIPLLALTHRWNYRQRVKLILVGLGNLRFLQVNPGWAGHPEGFLQVKFSDLSGIWKHVVFHVGMKISVSTWSFLSITIPSEYLFLCWKKKLDSTRKFVRNYLNWCTKYPNTSTTIRKILVPKKIVK